MQISRAQPYKALRGACVNFHLTHPLSTTPSTHLNTPNSSQWQPEYVHKFPPFLKTPCIYSNANPPSSIQRSAATKIDWAHITSSLGLKGSTATSLQAFKKRNDDARRKLAALTQQPQTVDFSRYRSTLNNTAVVDEMEQHLKNFKPVTYDVGRQLKAIEAFEAQAVKSAEETKGRVDLEVRELEKTLKNIETARPFEDLTVVCVSPVFFFVNLRDALRGLYWCWVHVAHETRLRDVIG